MKGTCFSLFLTETLYAVSIGYITVLKNYILIFNVRFSNKHQ